MITTPATGRLTHLVSALQNPAVFSHPTERFEVVETHISILLLTGPCVYKFLKPLDLGFLDFTSLQQRRHFCEEALRLNSRHAAEIYQDVIAITGDINSPEINGEGEVLEYALRMRQFDRNRELDKLAAKGELTPAIIDRLATAIAGFHEKADSRTGSDIQCVIDPVRQNLDHLEKALAGDPVYHDRIMQLQQWSYSEYERLQSTFESRMAEGFVRECHGDMHLGNIVLLDSEPVLFDCIDFSEQLRWIDVINDLAFLIMDLHEHEVVHHARRLLNRYLEISGDYTGLGVLRFYLVYRALVRAKIAAIRQDQHDDDASMDECHHYTDLAGTFIEPVHPVLFITCGLSGSGKTRIGGMLLEYNGAVRVRSDVERKRLRGLTAGESSHSSLGADMYSADMSRRTYSRLAELARTVIDAGYSAIVDATFLDEARRQTFMQLAGECNVPFVILYCHAGEATLRQRILQRAAAGGDASEADIKVLEYQLQHQQPLSENEKNRCLWIDTEQPLDPKILMHDIRSLTDP